MNGVVMMRNIPYSVSGLKDELIDLINRYPDNRNPMEGQFCLYSSVDGKSHCVIGQYMFEKGFEMPGHGERASIDAVIQYGSYFQHTWSDAQIQLLRNTQAWADDATSKHNAGWITILDSLEDYEY